MKELHFFDFGYSTFNFTSMDINNIILPNGKGIAQTKADGIIHTEKLYMEKWAKGHYLIYWDERSLKVGTAIRANADGSEDLVEYDDVTGRGTYKIKTLAEKGKGKRAYLLDRLEFQEIKKKQVRS